MTNLIPIAVELAEERCLPYVTDHQNYVSIQQPGSNGTTYQVTVMHPYGRSDVVRVQCQVELTPLEERLSAFYEFLNALNRGLVGSSFVLSDVSPKGVRQLVCMHDFRVVDDYIDQELLAEEVEAASEAVDSSLQACKNAAWTSDSLDDCLEILEHEQYRH